MPGTPATTATVLVATGKRSRGRPGWWPPVADPRSAGRAGRFPGGQPHLPEPPPPGPHGRCALFPNAEIVDFWARYREDLWLDHDGDGYRLSPHSQLWLTPGHSEEDASLIVEADDGVYAMTHLWWHADRTPALDPFASDQAALERGRERVLAAADVVIPGHGAPFRVRD
jgi:glyoxylase-like metal-dependent hydrolase (beta-lactamase superfamily II)